MARCSTRTILPLDRWAAVLGISPLHFNQVVLNADDPNTGRPMQPATVCGQPIIQYNWQYADRTGREDIGRAIRSAEDLLARWLGFQVGPTWTAEERTQYPTPANPAFIINSGMSLQGFYNSLSSKWGYVISGGKEAVSLIESDASVTYTDVDGDGYKETATVVVNTTVTEEQELALYFPGENGNATWEVRPLTNVSISSGVATIKCQRQQLVKPELWDTFTPVEVDGMDDDNFLDTVDVYRHYNDPSTMVRFLWQNYGISWLWDGWIACGSCGLSSCDSCVKNSQYGCLSVADAKLGRFIASPATWDADTESFTQQIWTDCRAPNEADIWYRSGWRDMSQRWPLLQMDPMWERAVALLALTFLNRPLCACTGLNAYMQHFKDDLAATTVTQGGSQTFKVDPGLLRCPLGTTRAGWTAWQEVIRERLGEAVTNR